MTVWIIVAHLHSAVIPFDVWVATGVTEYYSSQDECNLVRSAAEYITPDLDLECKPLHPPGKKD